MRKSFIVAAVVIILLVAVVVGLPYLSTQKSTPIVQTPPATVALQKLIAIPATCNFTGDGSVIADGLGKVYYVKTGVLRVNANSEGIQGYAVVSPNLAYAVNGSGRVFDVKTGAQLFAFQRGDTGFAGYTQFSPDSTIWVEPGTGVYAVPSGKQIMPLTRAQVEITISPDSKSLAITADGVYDLPSGQKRFAIGGTTDNYYEQTQRFSDDGKYLTVGFDGGVYEVATGHKMVDKGGGFFTPDDQYVVTREGVFRVDTGKAVLTYYAVVQPRLSDDGKRMFVYPEDTQTYKVVGSLVYDVATGQKIFENPSVGKASMSGDGRLLAIDGDGIYEVDTGTKHLPVPPKMAATFSADSSLIAIEGDGIYEAQTGKRISQIPTLHNEGFHAEVAFAKDFSSTVFSLDKRLVADDNALYEVSTGAKLADGPVYFLKDGSLALQTTIDREKYEYECTTYAVVPASSATPASTP